MRDLHHLYESPKDSEPPVAVDSGAAADFDHMETVFRAVSLRIEGNFDAAVALCDVLARQPVPDVHSLADADRDPQGFAQLHIGISYLLAGRLVDALPFFRRAHRLALEPFIRRDAAGKLALTHSLLGDLGMARSWLDEEAKHPPSHEATERMVRPARDVATTLLAIYRLDVDTAIETLLNYGLPEDQEELWAFVLYAWGKLGLTHGIPTKAMRAVEKHQMRFAGLRGRGAVAGPLLDGVRADLQLACHRPEVAAELVAGSSHPFTAPARARVLLLTDEPKAALELVRLAVSDMRCTWADAIELEMVGAAAALATGDSEEAVRYLEAAVLPAQHETFGSSILSLPRQVLRELSTLGPVIPVDVHAPGPEFGTLTFPGEAKVPSAPSTPLTEREIAVLRELATGATVRQIASRGFVSVNTVKTQLRSAYRKLGAGSREAAIAAARHHGII